MSINNRLERSGPSCSSTDSISFPVSYTQALHFTFQLVSSMAVACNHVIIWKSFQIPWKLLAALGSRGTLHTHIAHTLRLTNPLVLRSHLNVPSVTGWLMQFSPPLILLLSICICPLFWYISPVSLLTFLFYKSLHVSSLSVWVTHSALPQPSQWFVYFLGFCFCLFDFGCCFCLFWVCRLVWPETQVLTLTSSGWLWQQWLKWTSF